MNMPDPWDDFFLVFRDELATAVQWTPEQMDAAADEYQREQIASAQSEQAQEQLRNQYASHQR